jgi:hypothetical protein
MREEAGGGRQESEVRSQESEVRSQKSGVRGQKSGVRSQKVRSQKPEAAAARCLKKPLHQGAIVHSHRDRFGSPSRGVVGDRSQKSESEGRGAMLDH